ncbi:MAG TPA: hypothetical protein VM619_13810 [Luteimonas sp.]|nr:hypothetical protein [Luteimonas sp.]
MSRSKAPAPAASTSRIFGSGKSGDRGANVTSERIAEDLATFRAAGGRIEVLGNTRSLTKIGVDPALEAPASPGKDARAAAGKPSA